MKNSNILVVGDLHGEWGKFNMLISQKQPDIILQCGDFGWWPSFEVSTPILYGQQKIWLVKGIKPNQTKIYWCDGNHEEFPMLPDQDSCIHELYKNVNYCTRGSTLTLPDGRIVLFAGGGASVDKDKRTSGKDWFPEENITNEQLSSMLKYEHIDIVISHTCPSEFEIQGTEGKIQDANRYALDLILDKYKPKLWFFGHWHRHKEGTFNNTKWTCLDYPRHGNRWWKWLV